MNINSDLIKNVINVDNSINDNSRVNFIKGNNLLQTNEYIIKGTKNIYTFKEVGTYTLLIDSAVVTSGTSSIWLSGILKDNNLSQNQNNNYSTKIKHTFTITSNDIGGTLALYSSNGYISSQNVTTKFTNVMLVKGDVAITIPYEPYITPTINVDGEDIYSMPVVLYNNSTGSNSNITLSDNASNYNMISIDYFVSSSARVERKFIPYPQNKTCYLSTITPDPAGRLYINARSVTIQGTAINTTDSTRYTNTFINGSAITQSNSNEIYITKVLGYK